jgi:hypothetical protein
MPEDGPIRDELRGTGFDLRAPAYHPHEANERQNVQCHTAETGLRYCLSMDLCINGNSR